MEPSADPRFNSEVKRDRLPNATKLAQARPYLELAYHRYTASRSLSEALHQDVAVRFLTVRDSATNFPAVVADAVVDLIQVVAQSRNLACF